MNFFNNLKPMHLYLSSIICIVGSSLLKNDYHTFYIVFLVLGVILFFWGMTKRIKK
ncbi:hypothetical protein [Flavobacterium sp. GT3R68]|uniref:hypothetical protein n=1 Tax=Flavobacterium sp. GT3R68 TaxID=2594437 RepID=UPI00163DD7B2|nr:hypothetical protein [Flavobacterium sp. GT3R68]